MLFFPVRRATILCAVVVHSWPLFRLLKPFLDFLATNGYVRRGGNPKPHSASPDLHNIDRDALFGQYDSLADLSF